MPKPATASRSKSRSGGKRRAVAPPPKPRRSLLALITQIGAVASAIAAILGLLFLFLPGLKPKGPPAQKRAEIGLLKVERPVTYEQYLERTNLPGGDYTKAYLRRPGVFVQFDVEIVGYEGVRLPLRWSLYDARSGSQVRESESTTLRADAETDRATWHVWAALPHGRGRYFLLIQLFDKRGVVPLDRAETESFGGIA
jgi:hypothetical protein